MEGNNGLTLASQMAAKLAVQLRKVQGKSAEAQAAEQMAKGLMDTARAHRGAAGNLVHQLLAEAQPLNAQEQERSTRRARAKEFREREESESAWVRDEMSEIAEEIQRLRLDLEEQLQDNTDGKTSDRQRVRPHKIQQADERLED